MNGVGFEPARIEQVIGSALQTEDESRDGRPAK